MILALIGLCIVAAGAVSLHIWARADIKNEIDTASRILVGMAEWEGGEA